MKFQDKFYDMIDHNKCPSSEKSDEKCILRKSNFHHSEPKYELVLTPGPPSSVRVWDECCDQCSVHLCAVSGVPQCPLVSGEYNGGTATAQQTVPPLHHHQQFLSVHTLVHASCHVSVV